MVSDESGWCVVSGEWRVESIERKLCIWVDAHCLPISVGQSSAFEYSQKVSGSGVVAGAGGGGRRPWRRRAAAEEGVGGGGGGRTSAHHKVRAAVTCRLEHRVSGES